MTSTARAPRPTPRRPVQVETPPTRSHLRVVQPPERRNFSGAYRPAIVVVVIVVVFGALMASATLHGMLASGQADINNIQAETRQASGQLERERLELAHLRSPQRIAKAAESMGMVPSDTQHWVSAATGDESVVVRDQSPPVSSDTDSDSPSTNDPQASELAGPTYGQAQ